MRRLGYFLAAIFISPEIILGLLILAGFVYFPAYFHFLGEKIQSQSEVWKYLPTATIGLSIYSFKQSSNLRAPLKNSSNKTLYKWPSYQLLVDRVYVSMLFSITYAIAGLSIWVLGESVAYALTSLLFVASTMLAGTTALTMLLAHQKLVELLETHQ
jgi:hypothetical protein